jgi:endonuclease/exonuclease/phosphatase family metal-dependent hydrolase
MVRDKTEDDLEARLRETLERVYGEDGRLQKSSPSPNTTAEHPASRGQRKSAVVRKALLWSAILVYTVLLITVNVVYGLGAERYWWCLPLLYLPQWPWAVPGATLLVACLRLMPRTAWMPALAVIWVLGPQMGFRWNTSGSNSPSREGMSLRVMTYNVDGQPEASTVRHEISAASPDVLFLQEAPTPEQGRLDPMPGYSTAGPFSGCFVASREPITKVETLQLDGAPRWRQFLRCETTLRGKPVVLYCIHLDTPRGGFGVLLHGHLRSGAMTVMEDSSLRLKEAGGIARRIRLEKAPVIAAGDFNAPENSLVCRTMTDAGLRDAFSEAGRGYGYSYGHRLKAGLGYSYTRIDHIMVSKGWYARSCWAGGEDGSDHRPVIADVVLAPSATALR